MAITTGPEFWCVYVPTPTLRMIAWENKNRPKKLGTPTTNQKYWAKQKAAREKARNEYRADYDRLKEFGLHKERRFQYEETARKYAAEIERDHGVKMECNKGCDLYL